MKSSVVRFNIGKAGVTPGVINSLISILKNHKHVRISALPASGRNRTSIKEMASSIVSQLPMPCEYTIIGFTIALRRHTEKIIRHAGQK